MSPSSLNATTGGANARSSSVTQLPVLQDKTASPPGGMLILSLRLCCNCIWLLLLQYDGGDDQVLQKSVNVVASIWVIHRGLR